MKGGIKGRLRRVDIKKRGGIKAGCSIAGLREVDIKKAGLLTALPLALVLVLVMAKPRKDDAREPDDGAKSIVINEVCTKNNSLFIDACSIACDYIELYNPTEDEIDISGWYLSEEGDVLAKHRLRGAALSPGAFYVIYLDGFDDFTDEAILSGPVRSASQGEAVQFSLSSSSKEQVFLSDEGLNIVDSVEIPALGEDMTWSRTTDGGSEWGQRTATPLASNDGAASELPPIPEPVPIEEMDDRRYTVNISMLEEDLYDYETGIYIPGIVWDRFEERDVSDTGYKETDIALHSNWKMGWKRRARQQIFDNQGNLLDDRPVHVACHGNTSIVDDSKSLSVYADEGMFHLFDDTEGETSFILRNGGSERFQTKLRDPVLQAAAKDLNVSVQDFIVCDVYLNGEYKGPYMLMEKYSADYLAAHYAVQAGDTVILKNPVGSAAGYCVEGTKSDMADFVALWTYARDNDLNDDECYEYVASRLDIDSFIDYIAVEMYIANVDVYPNNNIYVWRVNPGYGADEANPYNDGRWRFMLQDLDASSGADLSFDSYEPDETRERIIVRPSIDNVVTNLVAWEGEGNESNFVTDPLFAGLMRREDFKERFTERLHYISENNYEAEAIAGRMEEAYHYISRVWEDFTGVKKKVLKGYVAEFDEFFEKRPEYIFDYLEQDFGEAESP